jgi:DNA-binding transcriptional ArsR family regulator
MSCVGLRSLQVLFIAIATTSMLAPFAVAEDLSIGPVEVDVDFQHVPHCTLGVTSELCLLSWDTGHDDGISDDEMELSLFAKRAEISIRPSTGSSQSFTVDPEELVVHYTLNDYLNATWHDINDTRPNAIKPYVEFQEGRVWWNGRYPWVLMVGVYYPTPIVVPGGPTVTHSQFVVYSPECSLYFNEHADGDKLCDYDEVRPLPNDGTSHDDSDRALTVVPFLLACSYSGMEYVNSEACALQDEAASVSNGAIEEWRDNAPNVGYTSGVDKVRAEVGPTPAPVSRTEGTPSPANMRAFQLQAASIEPRAKPPAAVRDTPRIETPPSIPPMTAIPVESYALASTPSFAENEASAGTWRRVVAAAIAGVSIIVLVVFALYHRLSRGAVLENENRQRILAAIQEKPGLRAGALRKEVGLSYPTVRSHLETLERLGLIFGTDEKQRRFFASGARAPNGLMDPPRTRILNVLQLQPEIEFSALCAMTRLPRSTASVVLAQLAQSGLVIKRRGRLGRMWLAAAPNHRDAPRGLRNPAPS